MKASKLCFVPLIFAAACSGDDELGDAGAPDAGAATDASVASDAGATADAAVAADAGVASNGLPLGESTWSGTAEVSGNSFGLEIVLNNAGGDLTAEVSFVQGLLQGSYSMSGTHSPVSGRVALAPNEWIVETNPLVELVGFIGTYDGSTETLDGVMVDYASGQDNSLQGGPGVFTKTGGDGAATMPGDGAASLQMGTQTFTGTHQCTGPVRDASATLDYDGMGYVQGTVSFGVPTFADGTHTFEVTGVHNPTTGGITLVPGIYVSQDFQFLTFFVDGTYDATGMDFNGQGRTNVGPCTGMWTTSL